MSNAKRRVKKTGFSGRGKYPAPSWAIEAAERYLDTLMADLTGNVMVELRPVAYCGPGSAGDRGAYVVEGYVGAHHVYHDVYPA